MYYEPAMDVSSMIDTLDVIHHGRDLRVARDPVWGVSGVELSLTIKLFPQALHAKDGFLEMPGKGVEAIGEHVISGRKVLEVDGYRVISFVHSWSIDDPGWGMGGLGLVDEAYLNEYLLDAWWIRSTSGSGTDLRGLLCEPLLNTRRVDWFVNDAASPVVWLGSAGGHVYLGERRRSLATGNLQVRVTCQADFGGDSAGVIGWCHAEIADGVVNVLELFVWPPYRQEGIAQSMMMLLAAQARMAGCGSWQMNVTRADDQVRPYQDEPDLLPRWLTDVPRRPRAGTTIASVSSGDLDDLLDRLDFAARSRGHGAT